LNAEPGADAALPGVFGVVSQDWLGCPVFVGPSVVACERWVVVAVVGCPVAATAPVANNAMLVAAQTSLRFMRDSFVGLAVASADPASVL